MFCNIFYYSDILLFRYPITLIFCVDFELYTHPRRSGVVAIKDVSGKEVQEDFASLSVLNRAKHPWISCQKISQANDPHIKSRLRSVVMSSMQACTHAEETGWQSSVWSCVMDGLLVQELNGGTVNTSLDNGKKTFVAYIDVANAFDTVWIFRLYSSRCVGCSIY